VSKFDFAQGIVVENDRCLRRIANIASTGTSYIFDPDKLIQAMNDLPGKGNGAFIFCSAAIATQMEIYNKDYLKTVTMFGEQVTSFRGQAPILICDAISNAETVVA